ncbi:MAG: class IV adenylate cyclase [Acidobacteria bacterium]|nr:class IV adenylate cyclase [Acidobacteriota bacterium]
MKLEVEIKLPVQDLTQFLEKLGGLRPRRISERKFEDNFILDLPQLKLSERGLLLRVRNEDGKGFLTFKGPARSSQTFKIREELETECDPAETLELFQQLGYRIAFRYQKYRAVYQVRAVADKKGKLQPVNVMIDETPIGNYAELEGTPQGVLRVAENLGYQRKQFIRGTYYSLFLAFCAKNRRSPRDMIFR